MKEGCTDRRDQVFGPRRPTMAELILPTITSVPVAEIADNSAA
jgi:hypothetical protein